MSMHLPFDFAGWNWIEAPVEGPGPEDEDELEGPEGSHWAATRAQRTVIWARMDSIVVCECLDVVVGDGPRRRGREASVFVIYA